MRPPNMPYSDSYFPWFPFPPWQMVECVVDGCRRGPGQMGRPGSKTGSPSSDSSINSTPYFHTLQTVFVWVGKLYFSVFVNCICHILYVYFSNLASCISLKQGAHLWTHQSIQLHLFILCKLFFVKRLNYILIFNVVLNIVIKVNILAAGGGRLELWKPCLLSKLWTRKPETRPSKALPAGSDALLYRTN